MPMAAKTATRMRATAAATMAKACTTPDSATTQPDLRKTMTPKMLIRQEVKTPSQVPKSTRSLTKKCDSHQGGAREP